tara:strand:+ start:102 stop:881 length:780 start_codon:yes stop_codon:yes gene_type:complete
MGQSSIPGYTIYETYDGETYYVNDETGESQWERPPPSHPPKPPPPREKSTLTGSAGAPWSGPGAETAVFPNTDLTIAKGAVVAIVVSLFLPYISIGGFGVSGIDMLEYWGEMAEAISEFEGGDDNSCAYANDGVCDEPWICESGTDENDCGGSSQADVPEVPVRGYMLMIGAVMVMFSPIVFLLSAIVGGITAFSGDRPPKLIGKLHLVYFGTLMLMLMMGGTILDDLIGEFGFSVISVIGVGLWIGGLAGIGFVYEKT